MEVTEEAAPTTPDITLRTCIRGIVRFAFSISKLQYNVAYHQQRTRRNIEAT
uniref:Uncharacterized protein n=1 Tax=Glossina palpalis gambiensis TaxID=67801 RepID=A0A1B0B4J6_9MUSC